MSKKEQILVIKPPVEVTFTGPFTEAVSSYIKLINPSEKKVCFKIKTTAPKRFRVKPNIGVVDPNTNVQVAVILEPFEYDPTEKNKTMFKVQSVFAPDGVINQDTLWKDVDENDLMVSKLRSVFALPLRQESDTSKAPTPEVPVTCRVPPCPKALVSIQTEILAELQQHLATEGWHLEVGDSGPALVMVNNSSPARLPADVKRDLAKTGITDGPFLLLIIKPTRTTTEKQETRIERLGDSRIEEGGFFLINTNATHLHDCDQNKVSLSNVADFLKK